MSITQEILKMKATLVLDIIVESVHEAWPGLGFLYEQNNPGLYHR